MLSVYLIVGSLQLISASLSLSPSLSSAIPTLSHTTLCSSSLSHVFSQTIINKDLKTMNQFVTISFHDKWDSVCTSGGDERNQWKILNPWYVLHGSQEWWKISIYFNFQLRKKENKYGRGRLVTNFCQLLMFSQIVTFGSILKRKDQDCQFPWKQQQPPPDCSSTCIHQAGQSSPSPPRPS